MSHTFTLDELRELMQACAGVEDDIDLSADIDDIEFEELGYDSLAVLEVASHVQRKYSVPMPDECVEYMKTPRLAVEYINEQFEKAGV
jgi:minimal PKS acyl carrier protein